MNLQDLINLSTKPLVLDSIMVTDNYSDENLEKIQKQLSSKSSHRLSILKIPYSEFYQMPDFCMELEKIGDDLDTLFNKTFAVYDKNYNFKGIFESEIDGDLSLKRNAYSVFLLLVYGFTKTEIMDVLQVSRSYISLIMGTLKDKCNPLLDYSKELDDGVPKFVKY